MVGTVAVAPRADQSGLQARWWLGGATAVPRAEQCANQCRPGGKRAVPTRFCRPTSRPLATDLGTMLRTRR